MIALVTGGSRGIGRAIVEEFCAAGYAVGFTYAGNEEAAKALIACVESKGQKAVGYQANARDYARAAEVVDAVQKELGPIDALINNAGVKRDGPLYNMAPEAWAEVIDTNLTGTFNYTRALMKSMIRRGGAVINITSVSGLIGLPGQTNYSASKAGLVGFTKALAKEVARFNVRVNAIAPGFIETDMTGSMNEEVKKKLYAQIPLGKPGTAQEVAKLALYLAGADAGYVTGQVWNIDGGMS